mmetsp:Transcript_19572/g.50551  ORF Transcript_19572/g.50551 Transcript_19572/m.50551 type:complete len:210 (+) Transcript_19572:483-1112(+)
MCARGGFRQPLGSAREPGEGLWQAVPCSARAEHGAVDVGQRRRSRRGAAADGPQRGGRARLARERAEACAHARGRPHVAHCLLRRHAPATCSAQSAARTYRAEMRGADGRAGARSLQAPGACGRRHARMRWAGPWWRAGGGSVRVGRLSGSVDFAVAHRRRPGSNAAFLRRLGKAVSNLWARCHLPRLAPRVRRRFLSPLVRHIESGCC